MPCIRFRAAISARTEGDRLPPGVTPEELDAHLEGCPDCRRWAKHVRTMRETTNALLLSRKRTGAPPKPV